MDNNKDKSQKNSKEEPVDLMKLAMIIHNIYGAGYGGDPRNNPDFRREYGTYNMFTGDYDLSSLD